MVWHDINPSSLPEMSTYLNIKYTQPRTLNWLQLIFLTFWIVQETSQPVSFLMIGQIRVLMLCFLSPWMIRICLLLVDLIWSIINLEAYSRPQFQFSHGIVCFARMKFSAERRESWYFAVALHSLESSLVSCRVLMLSPGRALGGMCLRRSKRRDHHRYP